MTAPRRFLPILVGGVVALAAVAAAALSGGDRLETLHLAARWTARASFLVFLPVFTASSIVRLAPSPTSKALLRDRRYWGLGFALAHFVHLGALITYLDAGGVPPTVKTLTIGGGGYVILLAMVLTSNDRAQRAMGVWWKRLHTLGIYWLWVAFAGSYAGRILNPDRRITGLIFTSLALAALGLRVAAAIRSRRRRA